jgi:hypothetical protein
MTRKGELMTKKGLDIFNIFGQGMGIVSKQLTESKKMKISKRLVKLAVKAASEAGYSEHREAAIDAFVKVFAELDPTWKAPFRKAYSRKELNFRKACNV